MSSSSSPADPSLGPLGDHVHVNGVNGATGEYLVPPLALDEALEMVLDAEVPDPLTPLRRRMERVAAMATQPHLVLPDYVDAERVAEAGWGVVFHAQENDAVKEALAPLIAWRRSQVEDEVFHVLDYHPGETWSGWLARHRVAAGNVDPRRVPYYLLIVGDPAAISFEFCHQIDLEYAVGRLHFDTPEEYERYARSVVAYENGDTRPRGREVVYFGPRHDRATQISADSLIAPLAFGLPGDDGAPGGTTPAGRAAFRTTTLMGGAATREALTDVLVADDHPGAAVLFSASHGMGWAIDDSRQRSETGALLCQDWPGLGPIAREHYFTAADLPDHAQVAGLIAIHFACFGAGIPERDRFIHEPGQLPPRISERPFLAALPQRMLAHPRGSALACIGHVDRAWSYSIAPPKVGPQILPFQNLIGRILRGKPVGYAMKDINERSAVLGAALSRKLEEVSYGRKYPREELIADWTQRNDAEGYLLIGDPAAALRLEDLV